MVGGASGWSKRGNKTLLAQNAHELNHTRAGQIKQVEMESEYMIAQMEADAEYPNSSLPVSMHHMERHLCGSSGPPAGQTSCDAIVDGYERIHLLESLRLRRLGRPCQRCLPKR